MPTLLNLKQVEEPQSKVKKSSSHTFDLIGILHGCMADYAHTEENKHDPECPNRNQLSLRIIASCCETIQENLTELQTIPLQIYANSMSIV